MILNGGRDVDLRGDGKRDPSARAEGKQGTIVHFLVNVGGGVWSGTKTLAAYHRPRWRVMLVAVYKGRLRPGFAEEVDEYFDAAYLVRRPPIKGVFYLAPVNVAAAIRALGLDPDADDVVYHFHTGPYTASTYRMPPQPRSGSWLASFHGARGSFRDVNNPAKRWLHAAGVKWLLKHHFTLVAVSHRTARDCAEMYGLRAADFRIAYNGTTNGGDPSRAAAGGPHRPLRVGFVGTVARAKGWRKVVGAVERLRQEGLDVLCSVIGDGPGFPELQRHAARHAEWLHAPGHLHRPAENVFPSLDVLVLPSDFEGHPQVLLEAMSCGVPCVCSDVGGCAETIRHGREGCILRANTVEEIAGYLKRILNGNGLWTTLSRNCVIRHREMFTAEKMAASWEQLYLEGRGD
jgi:glycosyltransferase involved in cell wall biosynthesis